MKHFILMGYMNCTLSRILTKCTVHYEDVLEPRACGKVYDMLHYVLMSEEEEAVQNAAINVFHIIQIYSGITRARVPNEELYAQRLQKLIYLY